MKTEANVGFWMYTGDRFLMYAEEYLQLNKQPEIIEEAEEIRVDNAATELDKISKSISFSPTLTKHMNLNIQSINESMSAAREAMKVIKSNYDLSAKKAIENLNESLSFIPKIYNFHEIASQKLLDEEDNTGEN